MTHMPMPPVTTTQDNALRRVGFEYEMAGLTPDTAADCIIRLFGGRKVERNPFDITVTDTPYGDFATEMDATLLKNQKYKTILETMGLDISKFIDEDRLDHLVLETSQNIVPCEIATPPLPLDKLHVAEELRQALHEQDAKGTKASILYAFGFQMNPEMPEVTTEAALRYLRAFLLLEDWMKETLNVDLTRRMTPFVDSFPEDYKALVLRPDYAPDLQHLVVDYLTHNPTRNRTLDMLPLFCFMDRSILEAATLDMHLIKARPALHYRLPNCLIDDPSWTVAAEWDMWLHVERLASDEKRLGEMAEAFMRLHGTPLSTLTRPWAAHVREMME